MTGLHRPQPHPKPGTQTVSMTLSPNINVGPHLCYKILWEIWRSVEAVIAAAYLGCIRLQHRPHSLVHIMEKAN